MVEDVSGVDDSAEEASGDDASAADGSVAAEASDSGAEDGPASAPEEESGSTGATADAAGGAGAAEAPRAARRAVRTSAMRSIKVFAPVPSGSLSGLYCATSRASRFLCFPNSISDSRTSKSERPPLSGTLVAGNSS